MRILSLGTGGFIGAHLSARLLEQGHQVVGVDNHTDKIQDILENPLLTYHQADIRDPGFDLEGLVRDSDLVIDLIAYANPGIYVKLPRQVFELNFTENLKIAEACVEHQKRLIQFSSCEVYGKTMAKVLPDKIKDPEDPALATFSEDATDCIMGPIGKHRWIYACAKQLLERVLHAYGLEDRLNYTIIRPFNFIGPKIDYLPEDTDGVPRVFSYFMEALLKGTEMQLVDGGHQRRCYTYIEDAIDCIMLIVENKGGVCDRQIFNVGSPRNEVSIRRMAELMLRIYSRKFMKPGQKLPRIVEVSGEDFYGPGYEDSDRRIPDTSKADSLLGCAPRYGLEELLELSMRYYIKDYAEDVREWREARAGQYIPSRSRPILPD